MAETLVETIKFIILQGLFSVNATRVIRRLGWVCSSFVFSVFQVRFEMINGNSDGDGDSAAFS